MAICSYVVLLLILSGCVDGRMESAFYADNDLQQTVRLDPVPTKDKKEMQQEILTLLGLHHRPKPIPRVKQNSAPRFMIDLYKQIQDEQEREEERGDIRGAEANSNLMRMNFSLGVMPDVSDADMIMSFVNHGRRGPRFRHEASRRFYFDFSEVSMVESVTGAELRLYKYPGKRKWMQRHLFTVNIYVIKQGADPEEKLIVPESNVTVQGDYKGWLEIDIKGGASVWTHKPRSNLGLYMTVTDQKGRVISPSAVGMVGRRGSEDQQPFLVAFFKMAEKLHVRKTRSARRKQRADSSYRDSQQQDWSWGPPKGKYVRKACQKRTMYVQFRDLGWQDWIIAPDGYASFYCAGECAFPLNQNMNATNHAIVQTLVHLMNPAKVPKPCCAPTKLSAISVLYFDQNSNVILKKYRNMVVKSCGCH